MRRSEGFRAGWLVALGAAVGSAWAAWPAAAQAPVGDQREQADGSGVVGSGVMEAFRGRLEALRAGDAWAYFELGEDVAAEAVDAEGVELARTLYVLAFELDRRSAGDGPGGDRTLRASVCLALADLERDDGPGEVRRAWLIALARTVDPRQASPSYLAAPSEVVADGTALALAEGVGFVRSGETPMARDRLGREDVRRLFEAKEELLSTTGSTGAVSRVEDYMKLWPCPECGNERVVPARTEQDPMRVRLCPRCGGNPGPRLGEEELVSHLRFESRLLSGVQRSWAAELIAGESGALRDPDPAELAPTFGVDGSLVLWRDGAWTRQAPDGSEVSGAGG